MTVLLFLTVVLGQCPGTGDCCVANGTAGCDDTACCVSVCAADPFCCSVEWDGLCAGLALDECAVCGAGCPNTGNCCEANGSPGCDDASCCGLVCAADPSCCDTLWDAACALAAAGLCPACQSGCPGGGDCCVNNGTPGCNDETCCELVCDADPFCCDSIWDGICADRAAELCALCGPVCADPVLVSTETFIAPATAFGGEQLAVTYGLSNPGECPVTVQLHASSVPVGGGVPLASPECVTAVLVPAFAQLTATRCFNLPAAVVPGLHLFCYEIRDAVTGETAGVLCRPDLVVLTTGDQNGDGETGLADMLALLEDWGPCENCDDCPADIDRDCEVGIVDLLTLLVNWTEGL